MNTKIKLNVAFAGILVLVIGILLFLNKLGMQLPVWLLTWPMLLMIIGLFKMIKHKLQHGSGVILFLIGGVFMAESLYPIFCVREFVVPIVFILIGLALLFRSGKKRDAGWYKMKCEKYKIRKAKYNTYEN
jgi:predicted membrane protein